MLTLTQSEIIGFGVAIALFVLNFILGFLLYHSRKERDTVVVKRECHYAPGGPELAPTLIIRGGNVSKVLCENMRSGKCESDRREEKAAYCHLLGE